MPRALLFIAILSLCAAQVPARATSASGSPEDRAKPKGVRHVLFRTDSPRLFVPAPPQPVAPRVKPREERARPRISAPTPRPAVPVPPAPEPSRLPPAPESTLPRRELDLQATTFTPYDPYLGTVRSVISRLDHREASMLTACDLMREGRMFRYLATDPYRAQPPSVTDARRAGDCKSKALWLYDHLGDSGAYYVIGKLERRSRTSHAWVYWRNEGRWWILDPTDRATPIAADSVASYRYVPYYSYSRAGKFRHKATSLMIASANGIPAAPSEPAVAVSARSDGMKVASRKSRR